MFTLNRATEKGWVYKIVLEDEPEKTLYVGQTRKPYQRWFEKHLGTTKSHNTLFCQYVQTHGLQDKIHIVVLESHDKISNKDLLAREKNWIRKLKPEHNFDWSGPAKTDFVMCPTCGVQVRHGAMFAHKRSMKHNRTEFSNCPCGMRVKTMGYKRHKQGKHHQAWRKEFFERITGSQDPSHA